MSSWNWISRSIRRPQTASRLNTRTRSRTMAFDTLEDRNTPAVVDLTTVGAAGTVNGALFRQFDGQAAGASDVDPFVRLQAKGCSSTEQGYNTDARKLQFDENKDRDFTRAIQLNELPKVTINGVAYRELMLDVNETASPPKGWKKGSQALISLDELRIFVGSTGNLSGYNTRTDKLAGMAPVYDLDAGTGRCGDNWIKLDSRLSKAGTGDMLAYIPEAAFGAGADDKYVYLYSKFGIHYAANPGFEAWSAGPTTPTPPANSGVISGTVIDAATGLGSARVVLFLDTNGNGDLDSDEMSTETDQQGHYSFSGLATGPTSTYLLTIIQPDNATIDPLSQLILLDQPGEHAVDVQFSIEFQTGGGNS